MNSPHVQQPLLLLPSRYAATVDFYALLASYPRVMIDTGLRFNKRDKETHRCTVADTHGLRTLTVPIEKPVSMTCALWSDILISPHGDWWHVHWETIKSAYGRTPFFEYYADDFAELFTHGAAGKSLTEFNCHLDALLRRFMLIDSNVSYGDASELDYENVIDMRFSRPEPYSATRPYYQVRSLTQGFHPSLSAFDLLFNLGPESTLYLPTYH